MSTENNVVYLSFDIEKPEHAYGILDSKGFSLKKSIGYILNMLDKYNAHATFFIVGEISHEIKRQIQHIAVMGHEIACHGFRHENLYNIPYNRLKDEIKKCRKILEDISGKGVIGFRAPSWSIGKKNQWVPYLLEELGFKYDSSIFPFFTGLYGDNCSPTTPYIIANNLLEIPPSIFSIYKLRIPFSGGVYLRLFPFRMWKFFVNKLITTQGFINTYFHAYDIYDSYKLRGIFLYKVMQLFRKKAPLKALRYILKNFKCETYSNYLAHFKIQE